MARHLFLLPLLAFSTVLACGESTADEDDDGSSFEEGGSEDNDNDGDGLTNDEEASLGTNPDLADSDLDGFDDAEEVDAGTDPLACDEVPEGWGDCSGQAEADGIEATGYTIGDVMPEWSGSDQFDAEVSDYQFYGKILILDFSAGWCGPCRLAAETANDVYEKHAEDGVMFMHVVIDDNSYDGEVQDDDFHKDWAEDYGLDFPVILDRSSSGTAAAYVGFYNEGYAGGIPFYASVGRDMVVVNAWTGASDAQLNSEIRDAKRLYE